MLLVFIGIAVCQTLGEEPGFTQKPTQLLAFRLPLSDTTWTEWSSL